jgi:hypothetical protein
MTELGSRIEFLMRLQKQIFELVYVFIATSIWKGVLGVLIVQNLPDLYH